MNIVKELFREYSKALNENLCFQNFDDELEDPLKKYGEPEGCLLLAYWSKTPAGCIALQRLAVNDVCEMKRLFVRPEFRNKGIGDELIKLLSNEAVEKGYKKMVLDTLERLDDAKRLYIKYGFVKTSAYYQNPLPNVIYMEKDL
jgi:ribosomal protein S18 acetylase RimI-like enzyme